MSRHGYSDDADPGDQSERWSAIRWRGMVASATRGRRGQAFFRDLLASLDAMPEKRLTSETLRDRRSGDVCTLGAVYLYGRMLILMEDEDEDEDEDEAHEMVAMHLDIAKCLADEVAYQNDDGGPRDETKEQRWTRMRAWAARQIIEEETK